MFRTIVALMLSICLIGCTSMKAVEVPTATSTAQVEAGDKVRVTTKVGRVYALEISKMADDSMTGRDEAGKLWKVPFDQIQTIEVEKVNAGKTAGATFAGIGLAAIALFVLGTIAFGKAMEDSDD